MDDFRNLDRDIEGSSKRWRKLVESECPEKEPLPQEWKNKTALQRLCVMRALRPDRMTYAVRFLNTTVRTYSTHDDRTVELPEKWNNLKKQSVLVKQQVAPLQAIQVTSLRQQCTSFDVEQHAFRERFRHDGPFRFDCDRPYQLLESFQEQISEREALMDSLLQSAGVFELTLPPFRQLLQCRHELGLLKELWDLISVVDSSMAAWKTTPWKDIQVEDMEQECKRFSKDIRGLNKEVRSWDAFEGLDSGVKNLLTSLRAVAELQNPAIRPRHWQQLIQATGVRFTMNQETSLADLLQLNLHCFEDEVRAIVDRAVKEMSMEKVLKELDSTWTGFHLQETSLADLLQLNLHCFEDEVRAIVDRAVKEMSMEKVLKELDSTWTGMQFQYEAHPRTQVLLLRSDEELMETLEDHQVQLQSLLSSKHISHFLEQVSGWQSRLCVADSVISMWLEVQRTWSHLESIFMGSEDIRTQLPEDSRRFEGIDADFKGLANAMQRTPNVVEATNKAGLFGSLEEIQSRLALCEKALAEYLDTKRLAFPRFYFISSADLLDVLSNGTNPQQVQKHLSKLFDNMAKMEFEMDEEGSPSKTALGMCSKESEYVPFNQPCDCSGQVEVWLNAVLDTMRSTVRHQMAEAVAAYEDKPRDQWLFDFPAQVALTGSQVWWASDVGLAFARLEEGYEGALKEYHKKQVSQLNTLISLLLGQLSPGERQKVMTICTIDVHGRDVVDKMVAQKVENSQAFVWLSQLRHRWDEAEKHCFANICDANFLYSYEYLGNTPRLVITPLTDRYGRSQLNTNECILLLLPCVQRTQTPGFEHKALSQPCVCASASALISPPPQPAENTLTTGL
uniref:Dynein heavy chain linker domain-containing protein n=1 Tax=Knipowitschia caucasica TaxID=637954 RepID=A0AAV2JSR2_KNICA